jgi:hypothetical protein
MLRKTVIALLAVGSVGLASPTMALARGGGGGGGGGHGGGGGGMGGGGFHGGGMGGGGFGDQEPSRLLQPEALLVPEWANRRGRLEVAGKEAALMPASMAAGAVSLVKP